jgi:hypothetical protein
MQDIVRRAILARLFLASEPDPVWPLTGNVGVDSLLADDATREQWRKLWQSRLSDIGWPEASEAARPAVDMISKDDR